MLPKKGRVTKNVFHSINKEGKTFHTPLFLFSYIKNQSCQYAFVAPKKVFKIAVLRNKFRRKGYNIIRSLPVKSGVGVFFYKKESEHQEYQVERCEGACH
jgi:RNase P protein component